MGGLMNLFPTDACGSFVSATKIALSNAVIQRKNRKYDRRRKRFSIYHKTIKNESFILFTKQN